MLEKKKKGDIAVNTAAILLLAVIAIALFISVFLTRYPKLSKEIYCKTISPIKIFFLPDLSQLEEKNCEEFNELKGKMLRRETAQQKFFNEKESIIAFDFPESGGSAEFSIKLPKAEISHAELNVSGFLYENETRFSDGEESRNLDFKGTETKEVNITLPKGAHVISARMNLSGNKTGEYTNVLVFTGYSNPGCLGGGTGLGDDVRAYLNFHRIKYDETHGWRQKGEEPEWRKKFENHSLLFVGCGLELTTTNDDDREFLKNWISQGNILIATCWAINLIVDLFGTGDITNGYTPYITRITPYQKCISPCDPYCRDIYTCQPTVGAGGACGDSQRINFTEAAARKYGVDPQVVQIVYTGSHCAYKTDTQNEDVTVLANIVYNPLSPLDKDIKIKCADKNNGYPGEAIIEFKYGNGTVLYMVPHIDEQLSNKLGETNFMINAINAFLPKVSNISISSINSSIIDWNQTGSLEKAQIASLNISKINEYLEECNEEKCIVSINITATQGLLFINNLLIEYLLPVYNVSLNIGSREIFVAENLNVSNSPLNINKSLKEDINEFLTGCNSYKCTLLLNITSKSEGRIVLSGLDIEYKVCLVKEEIVANALACWERADFGKSHKDISCYELSIPENCMVVEEVDEEKFTMTMIENNLCEVLPNNDANEKCGNDDRVDWRIKNVRPERNIFIKYSADEGKIIIS